MKKFRLLLMMVLTAAVSFTACDTPEKGDDVATPTVALTLEAEEVYAVPSWHSLLQPTPRRLRGW